MLNVKNSTCSAQSSSGEHELKVWNIAMKTKLYADDLHVFVF